MYFSSTAYTYTKDSGDTVTIDAVAIWWGDPFRHEYGSAMAEYLDRVLSDNEDDYTGDTDWAAHTVTDCMGRYS